MTAYIKPVLVWSLKGKPLFAVDAGEKLVA
jgi:hypothetical protein